MPKLGYDIKKIEGVFGRMIASDTFPTSSMLSELRKEINAFFTEATCVDILFTRNTDNLFFGMQVMPIIDPKTTLDIVLSDDSVRFKKYILELDSKLFSIGLTKEELTAVLLHEIGHIVTNDVPAKQVRITIDKYFASKDEVVKLKDSAQYTALLTFAIKDIIRKANSFIYMNNEEVKADAFVIMCGYGDHLESALNKVVTNAYGLSRSTKEPRNINVLAWIINIYTNVKLNRIPAIHTLKKAKVATGSVLEKRDMDEVIKSLNRIDTDVIREGAYLLDEASKHGLIKHIKASGYKAMDADYYEYRIRAKNMNNENDMIYLMRQINSRLTIILDTIEDLDPDDKERLKWQELYERYLELRNIVANNKISKKNYGLWYDYDLLDDEEKKYSMYS